MRSLRRAVLAAVSQNRGAAPSVGAGDFFVRHKIEPAGYRLVNQKRAYRAPLGDVAGGGTLAALPIPLGSLTELLLPPTLPGPAGMPLTPVVPALAEPAFGVPIALPDAAPPAVAPPAPAPCAKALAGNSSAETIAIAIVVDFLVIGSSVDRRRQTGMTGSCSSAEGMGLKIGRD